MTPEETAIATAAGIGAMGAGFMTAGDTYKRGAELGFAGLDFYVTGRGGVLGDVPAEVVAAAFVYFNPETVKENWDKGIKVMAPSKAAAEFAACGYVWAEAAIPDGVDAARLAELAGRVVAAADGAGAPLFAGWRLLPPPSSPKAKVLHHLNTLRELRGALHGGAVLACGLSPVEALAVRQPQMAGLFGWPDLPDVGDKAGLWQQAENGTNRAMARAFAVLSAGEGTELAELLTAATGA